MNTEILTALFAGLAIGQMVSGWQWGTRSSTMQVREIAERVGKLYAAVQEFGKHQTRKRRNTSGGAG